MTKKKNRLADRLRMMIGIYFSNPSTRSRPEQSLEEYLAEDLKDMTKEHLNWLLEEGQDIG